MSCTILHEEELNHESVKFDLRKNNEKDKIFNKGGPAEEVKINGMGLASMN